MTASSSDKYVTALADLSPLPSVPFCGLGHPGETLLQHFSQCGLRLLEQAVQPNDAPQPLATRS